MEELDDGFLGKCQTLQGDPLALLSFERFILNTGIYVGERFTFMSSVFFVSEDAIMKAEKAPEWGLGRSGRFVPLILADVLPLSQPGSRSWSRCDHIAQLSDTKLLGGRDPVSSPFSS